MGAVAREWRRYKQTSFNHSALLDIILLHAVIEVRVRVVSASAILKRILQETNAIETNPREARGICAARLHSRFEFRASDDGDDVLIFNGLDRDLKIVASCGLPNADTARKRPEPESSLK